MLITIPDLLTKEQVAQVRVRLNQAEWVDGKVTAGPAPSPLKSYATTLDATNITITVG